MPSRQNTSLAFSGFAGCLRTPGPLPDSGEAWNLYGPVSKSSISFPLTPALSIVGFCTLLQKVGDARGLCQSHRRQ
jgi:hypothetical protein